MGGFRSPSHPDPFLLLYSSLPGELAVVCTVVIAFSSNWMGVCPRSVSSFLAQLLHIPDDLVYSVRKGGKTEAKRQRGRSFFRSSPPPPPHLSRSLQVNHRRPFNYSHVTETLVFGRLYRNEEDLALLKKV